MTVILCIKNFVNIKKVPQYRIEMSCIIQTNVLYICVHLAFI